jgi:hypothetical protein
VLALHVLKQRERLAQGSEGVLDARLPVDFGGSVLGFEKRAHRSRDVLRDAERFFWNVSVLLERLERFAERFACLSRLAGG